MYVNCIIELALNNSLYHHLDRLDRMVTEERICGISLNSKSDMDASLYHVIDTCLDTFPERFSQNISIFRQISCFFSKYSENICLYF